MDIETLGGRNRQNEIKIFAEKAKVWYKKRALYVDLEPDVV